MAAKKNILKKKPKAQKKPKERKPLFVNLKKMFGFHLSDKAKAVIETPKDIISGDILEKKESSRLIPLLTWLTLLGFLYITNNYQAEEKTREINRKQKEIKELRYQYISKKSKLMNMSKQSQVVKILEKRGFKENTQPLKVIKVSRQEMETIKK